MSEPAQRPAIVSLRTADSAERWTALGFKVAEHQVRLGGVTVELEHEGQGIVGWQLTGIDPIDSLDGLATEVESAPPSAASGQHPNGAVGLDHVVVLTPRFARTAAALADAGIELRRIRQAPGGFRQGFRRLGPVILELVETPDAANGPARLWGLVVIVSDLDGLAERLGGQLGEVKAAVQPGRRIATLRASAGLGQAVAFMSPEAP